MNSVTNGDEKFEDPSIDTSQFSQRKFTRIDPSCEYYMYILETGPKDDGDDTLVRRYVKVNDRDYLHVNNDKTSEHDIKLKLKFLPDIGVWVYHNCKIKTHCNKYIDTWNGYLDQAKEFKNFRIEFDNIPSIISKSDNYNTVISESKLSHQAIHLTLFSEGDFYYVICDDKGWIKITRPVKLKLQLTSPPIAVEYFKPCVFYLEKVKGDL